MKRYLLTGVAVLAALEAIVWTLFRLRRPRPWRPAWLDGEVAKLHASSCEMPEVCMPESPICGTCLRARAEFMREWGAHTTAWLSLTDVQRESWRQEVAAA